jgi:hypothetical protein
LLLAGGNTSTHIPTNVPTGVHSLAISGRRLDDFGRRFQAAIAISERPGDEPIEDTRGLRHQFIQHLGRRPLFVRLDLDAPRHEVDAPPDAMIDALDCGLVIARQHELEVGAELEKVFEVRPREHRLAASERLDQPLKDSLLSDRTSIGSPCEHATTSTSRAILSASAGLSSSAGSTSSSSPCPRGNPLGGVRDEGMRGIQVATSAIRQRLQMIILLESSGLSVDRRT